MSDGSISSDLFERSFGPNDFESQVSELQVLLKNESLTVDTERLLQTLEKCFSLCAVDESLEERILKKSLPKAHRLLSQIIIAIDNATDDNARIDDLEDVRRKLHTCDGLLAFWWKCVEYISTFEKIRAPYVASLCRTLPQTIEIIFEHCKASPKTYGVLLSGTMQELKNLFSRTAQLFKLFIATLENVIVFDADEKSETELLIKVIDTHGNIASIAYGMDTKTFIEISEAFARLAVTYQDDIERVSPSNVTTHLARIAKDASHFLSTIKSQDDKNVERIIAATIRLMKILEQLTAAYGAFLTHEMLLNLVQLSAQMHGCSCVNTTKDGEKIILVDASSFLDVLFDHENFKQAYFEYGIRNDVHRLNYHLLTIAIVKKLNNIRYEQRCVWFLGPDSILDVAFTYIEYIQEEICVGELRLPGAHGIGERPRLAGIYEATLVPICDLVSQIPSEIFHVLELLLLKHLLSGRFWSSLLSSDVWCFIGRLGTSQLCADHVRHLIKVSICLAERRDNIEAILLNNMIDRLYELLTEDTKSALLRDLTNLDTDYYAPILYSLVAKTKNFYPEYLMCKLEDLPEVFSDLQEQPTANNWKRFIQIVSVMQTVDYNNNEKIIDVLIKIWNFVVDTITECEGKQLDLLSDFVIVLLDSTRLQNLRDDAFDSIMASMASSCIYMPPRTKIKLCQYLRRNVANFNRCGARSTSALTEIFSRLLKDESPWVHEEALESFESIGHACSERLIAKIAKSLAKVSSINNVMQAYLSSTPYYVLESFANMFDYLTYVIKIAQSHCNQHVCYKYEVREEKMPRLEEKNSRNIAPIILIQLDEQAEKLYEGLTKVLERRANISEAACKKLLIVLKKILKASEK